MYHSRSLSLSWVREGLYWSENSPCLKKVEKHWPNGWRLGPGKVGQGGLKALHLWRHSQKTRIPQAKKIFFRVQTRRLAASFETFTGSVEHTRPEKSHAKPHAFRRFFPKIPESEQTPKSENQWKSWYTTRNLFQQVSNCTISTGIPNLGVWCKKWSNWTSRVEVGKKNPTRLPVCQESHFDSTQKPPTPYNSDSATLVVTTFCATYPLRCIFKS